MTRTGCQSVYYFEYNEMYVQGEIEKSLGIVLQKERESLLEVCGVL